MSITPDLTATTEPVTVANFPATQVITSIDGYKTTYSAATSNISSAPLATDIFTITGSATKTIRITRIVIVGSQTTTSTITILLIKRSTANTLGTSAAVTAVPNDSNSAAATATILSYIANPTLGTLVGNMRSRKVFVATGASNANSDEFVSEFGTRNSQAIVLRGTNQVLAINLNGVTVSGGNFNMSVEWTEE